MAWEEGALSYTCVAYDEAPIIAQADAFFVLVS